MDETNFSSEVAAPGETRAATPSVAAVVVAHDPGEWFDEVVDSIVTQDYPRLTLVVIDHGTVGDLADRVARMAPQALVVRADRTVGFGAAANVARSVGLDSAYLLLCHDDVALASNAVSTLVTESLRSNAGIVGPKLVTWNQPEVLQHVGYRVDQFGATDEMVEAAELDQSQYDAVTDVFALPSACLLIRTQLFDDLGGFDPGISRRGESVDLCWRAQLAGARVLVVPDARVRHREGLVDRVGVDDVRRTTARHQIRTVLVTGGGWRLVWTTLQLLALSLSEVLLALATGRFRQVRDVLHAWLWNLARLGEIRRRRRQVRERQAVSFGEVRAAQERGSVRINAFLQGQIGRRSRSRADELWDTARTGTTRFAVLTWVGILAVVLFGSRSLIGSGVAAVGEFAPFPDQAGDFLSHWWSGWRSRELGSPGSSPTGFALLGLIGMIPGVTLALLRTLWVLLPVVAGLAGAFRLLRRSGSRRAQIASAVAYAVIPLPWAAMASGSWSGLAAYAVSPWILRAFLQAEGPQVFGGPAGRGWWSTPAVAGAGTAVALAGLFDPVVTLVGVLIGVGVLFGAFITVSVRGLIRVVLAVAGAATVTALLLLPFTVDQMVVGGSWAPFAGGRSGLASEDRAVDLLRFATGSDSGSPLVWAFGVLMVLPLLIGRGWRFDLAVRFWFVALTSWGLALAAAQGHLNVGIPAPAVVLAPAAVAVAALAGTTVLAFETDVVPRGRQRGRVLIALAVVAAVMATLPSLARIEDGRWDMGRGGFDRVLPLADPEVVGSYRVLWIGHPDLLPAASRHLKANMAWVVTQDGIPDVTERTLPADPGATDQLATVLDQILANDGARIGRALGAVGIRYVVGVEREAPAPFRDGQQAVPLPEPLRRAFDSQLDLRYLTGVNSAVQIYENLQWIPTRAMVDPGFDSTTAVLADVEAAPLVAAVPALAGSGDTFEGSVSEGAALYLSQTDDPGWHLQVDGVEQGRRTAFGWATVFDAGPGGTAQLDYRTPTWRHLVQLAQLALLMLCAGYWLRRRLEGAG